MYLRVDLKTCEACGSLFCRLETQHSCYCAHCDELLKDFPTPESRKRLGRPSRKAKMFRTAEVEA
jgi:hypothetical protein